MKNYHEMIQWLVDQVDSGQLRYNEWPVVMAIATAYGIPKQTVVDDVLFEKDIRAQVKKEQRRAEHRASNEQRRLDNLARKQHEQTN